MAVANQNPFGNPFGDPLAGVGVAQSYGDQTGGGSTATAPGNTPTASSSSGSNPFTDMLNHVSAFNSALASQFPKAPALGTTSIPGTTAVDSLPNTYGTAATTTTPSGTTSIPGTTAVDSLPNTYGTATTTPSGTTSIPGTTAVDSLPNTYGTATTTPSGTTSIPGTTAVDSLPNTYGTATTTPSGTTSIPGTTAVDSLPNTYGTATTPPPATTGKQRAVGAAPVVTPDAGGTPYTAAWEQYWQKQNPSGGAPRPANLDPTNLDQVASWYRTVLGQGDVTAADVSAFRYLVTSGQLDPKTGFDNYYQGIGKDIKRNMAATGTSGFNYQLPAGLFPAGHQATPYNGLPAAGPGPGGAGAAPQPVTQQAAPAPPPGTTTPPPATTTPTSIPGTTAVDSLPNTYGTAATTTASGITPLDANIQSLIDQFNNNLKSQQGTDIASAMNPLFAQQRSQMDQQLQAQAALTPGRTQSGGFGQNEALAMSNLTAQQGATLGTLTQTEQLAKMQQNTTLMSLATTAGMQKYTTDIQADLTKFSVNTNADLQRWLDTQDNVLKKYGIDTNDVLARYQAQLQLQGVQYSANAQVSSAQLYAAASAAAAGAAANASMNNAQLQYQASIAGLGVTQQNNEANFILGLLGLNNANIGDLSSIINSILGNPTYVKP